MLGSALKKLAKENGMTIKGGIAYGSLGGFAATMYETAGCKRIDFAVSFPDPANRVKVSDTLADGSLRTTYRVQNIGFSPKAIQVIFTDSVGTMKRIRAFLDYFLPLLRENSAITVDFCAECGSPVTNPVWANINGICFPMHEHCAERVRVALEEENARRLAEDSGNYITGTLGALIGALLGAAVWALVLNGGYVASLVGMLIGFLAEKGYNLAKGKQGKGKTFVLILVTILAVVLGTFGSDAIEIAKLLAEGSLPGFGIADIPMFILALWADNPDYRSAVISNLGTGLLFAALGVFVVIRNSARNVSGAKFRYMK